MKLEKKAWGTAKTGETVYRYTLSNRNGMSVSVCNVGCSILSIIVPDRNGAFTDVALAYETCGDYNRNPASFGCVVGRYGNRIKGGCFRFAGKTWQLEQNEGKNHLHGASGAYGRRFWPVAEESEEALTFCLKSPDGDGGYPGDLTSRVTYRISEDNELSISYHITTETEAFCNLTNHCYFNLSGHDAGTILDHEVFIGADAITEVNEESIPTGVLLPIGGTDFDFNTPKAIGRDIGGSHPQLAFGGGYDHNYVLNKTDGVNASAYSPKSGIFMEVSTNSPGLQFYTANSLEEHEAGKGGAHYGNRSGFCMETQFFPDSVNQPAFPSCVVTKEAPLDLHTAYRFSIK
ncbi:MAG: galactose mutarotase [Lachnospiraceae bacterium]|jgi:aldose 1-epimerase|nr:galactose mutarotase [Lachnospiraceae bacterium]